VHTSHSRSTSKAKKAPVSVVTATFMAAPKSGHTRAQTERGACADVHRAKTSVV
jgi:hypothetical protein